MNGFSTLNRLLGKKSKSQTISKSTSNLSNNSSLTVRPLSQYDTSGTSISSHMETNSSNVPFEHTFRITVHLPKGQLFVTRCGAKTELEKLLILVCENKQLDPSKYELRHPGDNSQAFGLDQTIGAVGLSELRLCHRSESYDSFNSGEILTLRNTVGRDSLSSSELSSRHSKHTLKTASPYSSTNSLNSSDSAGMSYRGYAHQPLSLQSNAQMKPPVAPARKKRAAPRPPSQNSTTPSNGSNGNETTDTLKQQDSPQTPSTPEIKESPLARKEFHLSSPNLTVHSEMTLLRTTDFHKSNVSVDCNGNSRNSQDNNSLTNGSSNGHIHCNGTSVAEEARQTLSPSLSLTARPVSMSVLNNEIHYEENELNGNREFNVNGSVSDLSPTKELPEPAPRKRIILAKKKAPAPPPRGLQPVATPRVSATNKNTPEIVLEVSQTEENADAEIVPKDSKQKTIPEPIQIIQMHKEARSASSPQSPQIPPTPLPTPTTPSSTTELTIGAVKQSEQVCKISIHQNGKALSSEITNGHVEEVQPKLNTSKTQNSVKKPLEQSPSTTPLTPATPSEHLQLEKKLSSGTSSDDDDQVKVYNIKLGKTIVQPLTSYEGSSENSENKPESQPYPPKTTQNLSIRTESTPSPVSTMSATSPLRAESPEWSYTIPAPATFADTDTVAATYRSDGLDRISPSNGSLLSDRDDSLTTSIDFNHETTTTSDMEDGYRGGENKKTQEKITNPTQSIIIANGSETKPKDFIATPALKDEAVTKNHERTSSVSPPRSPAESKAEIITELNNLVNGEHGSDLSTVMKRSSDRDNEKRIESAKPSELTNFTIQTYSKPSTIETTEAKTEVKIEESKTVADASNYEENLYTKSTKRPSLTLSNSIVGQITRQRAMNITRSDSFHSTRAETRIESGNLSHSRSTSQVSLETMQKHPSLIDTFLDTNRRKSSSELSIGEAPSLQSLIVMKSILGSRKNSLTNGNTGSEKGQKLLEPLEIIPPTPTSPVPSLEMENSTVIETVNTMYQRPSLKDFVSVSGDDVTVQESFERKSHQTECSNTQLIEIKSKETKMANGHSNHINSHQHIPLVTPADQDISKENSPKNNITSQKSNDAKPLNSAPEPAERIYRYQGPPSINLSTWSERPKSQVAIKSDGDYIFGVGKGSARLSIAGENRAESARDTVKAPVLRSIELKKTTSMVESRTQPQQEPQNRLEENVTLRDPKHLARPMSVTNSLLLGRTMPMTNKSNFVPVVKGFKSLDPVVAAEPAAPEASKDASSIETVTLRPSNVVRSNSSVSTNILRLSTGTNSLQRVPKTPKLFSPPPTQTDTTPMFAQVALRKTGLKEKILASSDTVDSPPKLKPLRSLSDQNSAKIEMKITTTNTVTANPAVSVSPIPNVGSMPNRSTITINSEVPPPPPPIIRSVVTKQNSLGKSACIPDTRDQLLSAIRNFNKDSLRRS